MLFSEVAAFGVTILENRCQLLGEYALIPAQLQISVAYFCSIGLYFLV